MLSSGIPTTGCWKRAIRWIWLVAGPLLDTLDTQIKALNRRIRELLDAHPDSHIFRSLPRAGTIRAAALLAEIGDCRARFPEPESLSCLAGVAPSTRASGKHRAVTFRWAANKKLRDAICDFASDTPNGNEWARHRYQQLRADGKSHPMPNASSPAPGSTSSGDAGRTESPTILLATAPSYASKTQPA